jgi:uncharacterized membrane protein
MPKGENLGSPVTATSTEYEGLVERLRKMARCIYIAVEPTVADDIAYGLNQAADAIEALEGGKNETDLV